MAFIGAKAFRPKKPQENMQLASMSVIDPAARACCRKRD
jgi:hypothetical protein